MVLLGKSPEFTERSGMPKRPKPQLRFEQDQETSNADRIQSVILPRPADHAESSTSRPSKRQKVFYDHLGNLIPGSRNGLPTSRDDYHIVWICQLHIEMTAACAMLDERHEDLPIHLTDSNTYALGRIKQHNVVIACLQMIRYGTNNASNFLKDLTRTFPSLRLALMVGIGCGAPSSMADIRLGDVVVGTRLMHYDSEKTLGDRQIPLTVTARRVLHSVLNKLVSNLRSEHELGPSRVPSILRERFEEYPEYSRPNSLDFLFRATYDHVSQISFCEECDHSNLVSRINRHSDDPGIHYGAIASGDQAIMSGTTRDSIARELNVVCFEIEAADVMDFLPCLSIRGICNYADSHQNKEWQRYAAATATAYARELLEVFPVAETHAEAVKVPDTRKLYVLPICTDHHI